MRIVKKYVDKKKRERYYKKTYQKSAKTRPKKIKKASE